jgi:hypothetical protein
MSLFLNDVILPVFDWFNDRSLLIKILLFITGLAGIASFLMALFRAMALIISHLTQTHLYISTTIVVISWIQVTLNIISILSKMGDIYRSTHGFWMWIEFIMIITFIIQVNWLFIMKKTYNERFTSISSNYDS